MCVIIKNIPPSSISPFLFISFLAFFNLPAMPEQIKRFYTLFPVPGDGGSQVDAKLNKPSVVHYICEKQSSDYFNIWLNLELLVPIVIDCWVSFFLITFIFNFNEWFKLDNCSLLLFLFCILANF